MKKTYLYKVAIMILVISIIVTGQTYAQSYSGYMAAPKIASIKDIAETAVVGSKYVLPTKVQAIMTDKTTQSVAISWGKSKASTSKTGKFTFQGTVKGYTKKVKLTLTVQSAPVISSIKDITVEINAGTSYTLPTTVEAVMSDKSKKQVAIKWQQHKVDTTKAGTAKFAGTVQGYKQEVNLQLTITKLTVQDIAKEANKIVLIKVYDEDGEDMGSGSGFFISETGLIATNFHVIDYADSIDVVTSDNKTYPVAYVAYFDVARDTAIIKIDAPDKFPYVKIGDSNKLELGQEVIAIGNPLGLQNTVSTGIVSSIRNNSYRTAPGSKDIQISAPISPGSSGGALFNMYGEVVGITYARELDGQNLNYAIPINEIKGVSTEGRYNLVNLYESLHLIKYENGDTYEGDKVDGVPDGLGILLFANGDMYFGDWAKGARTGLGILKTKDGDTYKGEFVNGKFHGVGEYKFADGTIYEGQFANDEMEGVGTVTYPDGEIYVGEWKTSNYHGKGKIRFSDGTLYEGEFANGDPIGRGTYTIRGNKVNGTWQGKTFVPDSN